MMFEPDDESNIAPWIGAILGSLAGVVYLCTLSAGPFPGESAGLIMQHSGLTPLMSTANPLWSTVAWLFSHIPIGSLATRLNLLSAICGAASVGLFYYLIAGTVYHTIEEETTDRVTAGKAAQLAGISGSLFLAFSIPFWIVSNRAYSFTFDILLLLSATYLCYRYANRLTPGTLLLFAFVYGLGTAEFTTFILLAPVFAAYLLVVLWMKNKLETSLLVKLALCYAAGLLLYLFTALRFYFSEGSSFQEHMSLWQVLVAIWRNQYLLIAHSLPKVWWLLILIIGIVPWLACLMVARRGLNAESEWSYFILHLAMTGVLGMVVFDVRITPWQLLGMKKLLVTPYVLLAAVYGYLVAYWYLLAPANWSGGERRLPPWLRQWLGPMLIAPAMAALCIAPFLNFRYANAREARVINDYAEAVVECLDARKWLVTDGFLDSNITIAAAERRKPLRLLNLALGNTETYMRYVKTFLTSPRLRSLAEVGMPPLLLEWLSSDPGVANEMAILAAPDIWVSAGLTPVPNKTLFTAVRDIKDVDVKKLVEEHEKFWREMVPRLKSAAKTRDRGVAPYANRLLMHTSLLANNVGVLLADLGRASEAYAAYARAREIHPDNLSSLMNQYSMLENGFAAKDADAVRKRFNEVLDESRKAQRPYNIALISRSFGYIRTPQAFANLGWASALSGNPTLGMAGLKKAIGLGSERNDRVKQALAFLQLTQNQDEESEALYRELIAKNNKDGSPYIGLARIAAKKGDFDTAGSMLEMASKKGVEKSVVAIQWALLHLMKGEVGNARYLLEDLVKTDPSAAHAWLVLAGILIQQHDNTKALDECAARLSSMKGQEVSSAIVIGQIALMRNDLPTARKSLERAIMLRPNALTTLETLLKLDVLENRRDLALKHVGEMLTIDPGHAMANYILGSMQIERSENELAESSLRRSIGREKSAAALNDLAWLLAEKNSYAEAEKCAREATEMNGNLSQAYDTLGVIMMKTDRLNDAERNFDKALSITKDSPNIQIHMAELQLKKSNNSRAREFLDMAALRRSELSSHDATTLDNLYRRTK